MRALLITNPNSTTLNPRTQREIIQRLLDVPDLHFTAQFTQYPKHAQEMVSGLRRSDYDLVIVLGGDGTVNEVFNGLLGEVGSQLPAAQLPRLLIIPTGSANVFVRALGFPQDPGEAAKIGAELLEKQVSKKIEAATWDKHWFVANAGVGIDANVVAAMEKVRASGKGATPLRYLAFGLRYWLQLRLQPPSIHFAATNRAGHTQDYHDVPLFFVANTNPWTFLGPVPVITNPQNTLTRGLGVYALRSLAGISGILAMANLVGLGQSPQAQKRVAKRRIRVDDAAEVKVYCDTPLRFQVDGEYVGEITEMTFSSVPEAIEIYKPAKPRRPDAVSALRAMRNFLPFA